LCNTEKPVGEFPLTKRSDGAWRPSSRCRECRRTWAREYARERAGNPEYVAQCRIRDEKRYAKTKADPEAWEAEVRAACELALVAVANRGEPIGLALGSAA
jgi:hypothetical protein